MLFRTSQPRKLCVEGSDRSTCSFLCFRPWQSRWRRRHQGAPGTVIATKDFAAARALTAQLLRILVEKNIGVACHSTPLMLGLSEFLERM